MSQIIFRGKIDSDFEGFDDNAIFKMSDGSYWVQSQYAYWYHYAYRPDAVISREQGRTYLVVAEHKVQIERINDVIERRIEGEFRGWSGDTQYKLSNGQIWMQVAYKYQYTYSYCPEVIICNIGGTYICSVAGTQAVVRRIK